MRFVFAANLKKEIPNAKNMDKPSVFLGGDCSDNNAWREDIKKRFSDKFRFLDPYDEDWTPEKNIYDELAGLVVADFVIFYKGGDGSAKEKAFLDTISGGDYFDFDDIEDLAKFLSKNEGRPQRGLADMLRKKAFTLHRMALHENLKTIKDIKNILAHIAQAAQKAYDEWEQDEEGTDPELGSGGICQDIAENIAGLLNEHEIEAATVSQTIGDQHVSTYAKVKEGIALVDINPHIYETGGGYTWKKKKDVKIQPQDIEVHLIDGDPDRFEEMTRE